MFSSTHLLLPLCNADCFPLFFFCSVLLITTSECNSTSAVKISHHFINRLINEKRRGLVTFTSSSGGFMPSPMAAIYGSSKALMTESVATHSPLKHLLQQLILIFVTQNRFATSIACEVKDYGIDVVVVHPSPINSRFYDNAGRLDMLKFFKATAVTLSLVLVMHFFLTADRLLYDKGIARCDC